MFEKLWFQCPLKLKYQKRRIICKKNPKFQIINTDYLPENCPIYINEIVDKFDERILEKE